MNASELKPGTIVSGWITGQIGKYYFKIMNPSQGEPRLQVVDENGVPDESWSAFILKPGDYILMEVVKECEP